MKRFARLSLITGLILSGAAFVHAADMQGMEMKKGCMDRKEMKGMNMQECMDGMKEKMPIGKVQGKSGTVAVHKTSAVVKTVNAANGKVTLAHGPVATLNWPSMTMTFGVRDKALLEKLAVGKKVNLEFTEEGGHYIITSVLPLRED